MASLITNEKPQSVEDFKKWLKTIIPSFSSEKAESYYKLAISDLKEQFCNSTFFVELIDNWDNYNYEYRIKTKDYSLFESAPPEIFEKPYSSILNKSFRKNILNNENWPEKPKELSNWITPYNCFNELNDCLRTQVIVKYLDGADFILDKLKTLAKKYKLKDDYDYEAKEKGYYAIHYYVFYPFKLTTESFEKKDLIMRIEFQITTQIQNTIYKLTHGSYEKRRINVEENELKWQWDYKNDDFKINYLGHILHYLEGMIIEIRDKKEIKDGKEL